MNFQHFIKEMDWLERKLSCLKQIIRMCRKKLNKITPTRDDNGNNLLKESCSRRSTRSTLSVGWVHG